MINFIRTTDHLCVTLEERKIEAVP